MKIVGDNIKYSIDYIREFSSKEGYILVSKEYKRAKDKLIFICPKGHNYLVCWEKFYRRGFRCSECSGKGPDGRTEQDIRDRFSLVGYTLTGTYTKAIEPVEFQCDKGHSHTIIPNNLTKGQRCGKCFEEFEKGRTSKAEEELFSYFQNKSLDVIRRDRSIIKPLELDFYFPQNKLAVEYCGLYWHRDGSGKDRNYHYNKMKMCQEKDIRLITIFEDEYLEKPEVVISRISNALGIYDKRVFARKCSVDYISKEQASSFLNDNHLQGYGRSSVRLGLFHNQELIGVMTGSLPARAHISKNKVLEMKRLAFLSGYSVVGGASKLFSRFLFWARENKYQEIRSYCDMRYGNIFHTVYDSLGFTLLTETKYTPHYFKGQKRFRNQSLAKTSEERLTGKTEWELRQEQGYRRIWDCGHRTYIFDLGE